MALMLKNASTCKLWIEGRVSQSLATCFPPMLRMTLLSCALYLHCKIMCCQGGTNFHVSSLAFLFTRRPTGLYVPLKDTLFIEF